MGVPHGAGNRAGDNVSALSGEDVELGDGRDFNIGVGQS